MGRAPDPRYAAAYRRMRVYLVAMMAGMLVTVVGGLVNIATDDPRTFGGANPLTVAVAGMLLWGAMHSLWIYSVCPRCDGRWGMRRRKDRKALLRFPAMRCLHCGLPFAAARDPDSEE